MTSTTTTTKAAGPSADPLRMSVSDQRPRRAVTRQGKMAWFVVALGLLALACTLSIVVGARDVSFDDIVAALSGASGSYSEAAVGKRIPRTALAVLVGAALAVSGLMFQGVTRNPLAEPGILGINSGASLAVVIGIVFFGLNAATSYIWVAILGAALASVFVWFAGSTGPGGPTPLSLTLAGAATSAALISGVTAVMLPRPDIGDRAIAWQIGGVGGATSTSLLHLLPFFIVGMLLSMALARGLNLLSLGDDLAAGLGAKVARTRLLGALGGVILCGSVTAVAGPIFFVGLVIPHFCRLMVGTDYRWLLPFSAITGAAFVTIADVVGRIVQPPTEVDVGVIAALIGAPIFIAVVRRRKVREL